MKVFAYIAACRACDVTVREFMELTCSSVVLYSRICWWQLMTSIELMTVMNVIKRVLQLRDQMFFFCDGSLN